MIAGRHSVSLGRRIILGFSALILLFLWSTVLLEVVGIPGTEHQGRFARNRAIVLNDMELVSELLRERMVSWFRERRVDVDGLAAAPLFRRSLELPDGRIREELVRELQGFQKSHPDFQSVAILCPDGGGVRSAIGGFQGAKTGGELGIPPGRLASLVVPGYLEVIELRNGADRKPQLRIIRQIMSATDPDRIVALVVADSDVESAMSRLVSVVGGRLSREWECVIASGSGGVIAPFLGLDNRAAAQPLAAEGGSPFVPVRLALSGMDASYDGPDQRGRPVLAFHRQIKVDRDVVLALVITMDRSLALRPAWDELFRQVLTLLIMLVVGVGLCILFARQLSRPIQELALAARRVASGDLGARAEVKDRSEVGQLAEVFNGMVEQLEAWRRDLEAARDAAETANRAKSEFLANMSHEIRTPMNAVLGLTQLALQTELTDKQREYLHKTQIAAEALLGIINDILDFSKIEARKLQVDTQEFLLEDVFNRVIQLVGAKSAEKSLEFMLDTAADVPAALVGDPLRLGQVLTNLCSNAVKFTEAGEVILMTVKRGEREDGKVILQFSVRDTGIGMTPEQVNELFRPFSQVDPSSTRRFGGTGLGLAISRNLVELMGGEIWAQSELGKGSTFFFTATFGIGHLQPGHAGVPSREAGTPKNLITEGHGSSSGVDLSSPGSMEEPHLKGLRVLLVEDNTFNQQVAMEFLGLMGVEATLASNGQEALDKIAAKPFDAVLMDLQMPGMDGYEATRRIRMDDRLKSMPILALTAHAMVQERNRCLAMGMDGYLTKPIAPKELASALIECTRRRGNSVGDPLPTISGPGAPHTSRRSPSPDLPGISWEDGLDNFAGRVELFELMLGRFMELKTGSAREIRAALDQGDREGAHRMAHSMISSAGTIGAQELAAASKALQDILGPEGDMASLESALERYERALAVVLDGLKARRGQT